MCVIAFLLQKVSFLNEMRSISDKVGANWDQVIEGFVRDGRVGHSHINVPGPDGKFGLVEVVFLKNMTAINFFEKNNEEANVLKGVWKRNLVARPEKDWGKFERQSNC